MLTVANQKEPPHSDSGSTRSWNRRLIILLTILAAMALVVTIFWGISHVITSVLVVVIAALIAYAIAPAVGILNKVMPRALAILLAYLIVLIILGVIYYSVVSTAIFQIGLLVNSVGGWLTPDHSGRVPLLVLLLKLGLTQAQINALEQQIVSTLSNLAGSLAGGILPLLGGVANWLLNILLTVVSGFYLFVD